MDHAPLSPSRIHAIDAIRGFCLLNIFVNHLNSGMVQNLSPSRIMFADSADGFVFLAGISCFLAYGARDGAPLTALRPNRLWNRVWSRVWSRALSLFAVNTLVAALSIVILLIAGMIAAADVPEIEPGHMIAKYGIGTYVWHVFTMQEVVGYSVVLRLYVALLLAAPFYIWLAGRRFWYPLVPAGAVWLIAGQFGLAEQSSLSTVPLALTLLPWNFIFACGIALGAGIVQGRALPTPRWLTVAAALIVLSGPVCFTVLTRADPAVLDWVNARNDDFWTGASKSLQSPLRVGYMLALAYLFIAWRAAPVVRLIHRVAPSHVLSRLGRRSLEVFASGAVIVLAADRTLWALIQHDWLDRGSLAALAVELAMLWAAFLVMLRIADSPACNVEAIRARIVLWLRPRHDRAASSRAA